MPNEVNPAPSGGTTDWEAEAKKLQDQVKGLSTERNQYRQKLQAWERIKEKAPDVFKFDNYGNPVDFSVEEPTPAPAGTGVNPFADLEVDAEQVQRYLESVISQKGFLTKAEADQLADAKAVQAYQAAVGHFSTMRSVDKLLSDKTYSDLSNYESDWSKRTADIIRRENAGQPANEASRSWDEWQFTGPRVLQQAADVAYAQMVREREASAASAEQANKAQQTASLSVGVTGSAPPPGGTDWKKSAEDGNLADFMRQETERRAMQLGIVK